jgi:guanine deaminase
MTVWRARVLTPISSTAVGWWPDARVTLDEGGRITEIADWSGGTPDRWLRGGVLTPGFVDAHVHFPQTRIVGAASGPLLDWLDQTTFPEEARFADPRHAAQVAALFTDALARSGTTLAFAYGPVFPAATDALLQAADARGLRVITGPVLMDVHCPPALQLPADRALPALEALVARWHGHDGRITVAAVPRFALCCSAELMRGAAALADAHQLPISTHLSENPIECSVATTRWSARDYLSIYEDLGLIGPRSVLAHCIHLSPDEWDRFAAAGAVVAHCPDSNAFLGSGHFPTGEALARGVPIALGTDVAAGRSFRVARTASYAYDNALAVGVALRPEALFWWATRGGALALGVPAVGAIAAGCDADVAWHDLPPWVDTAEGALATLLFDADAPGPREVWVRGRSVYTRPDAREDADVQ